MEIIGVIPARYGSSQMCIRDRGQSDEPDTHHIPDKTER